MFASASGYQDYSGHANLDRDQQPLSIRLVSSAPVTPAEPKMVLIQNGCYQMGSPASEAGRSNNEKQHRVCVDDVLAATNETTVAQFRVFVQATNYHSDAERDAGGEQGCNSIKNGDLVWLEGRSWRNPGFDQSDREPVVCVSWNDAVAFTEWLADQTGKPYRLPTEAEWEYAARAGTTTASYWGDSSAVACRNGNVADEAYKVYNEFAGHSCDDGIVHTAQVGSYAPNDYGLYDVLGNAWEWTCSEYDIMGYDGSESRCEKGQSAQRAIRGGGYNWLPGRVRSAMRNRNDPDDRYNDLGFRVFQDVH